MLRPCFMTSVLQSNSGTRACQNQNKAHVLVQFRYQSIPAQSITETMQQSQVSESLFKRQRMPRRRQGRILRQEMLRLPAKKGKLPGHRTTTRLQAKITRHPKSPHFFPRFSKKRKLAAWEALRLPAKTHVSCSLNSLKGGYIGD